MTRSARRSETIEAALARFDEHSIACDGALSLAAAALLHPPNRVDERLDDRGAAATAVAATPCPGLDGALGANSPKSPADWLIGLTPNHVIRRPTNCDGIFW